MNQRNLIAILLLIIGILIGIVGMMGLELFDRYQRPEVQVTELQKSPREAFSKTDSTRERTPFNKVADQVVPSVVFIQAMVDVNVPEDGNHGFFDQMMPSPRAQTVGSGVIISKDGYIITNNHVIEGAVKNNVSVSLNDNRILNGTVVGRDPSTDIAVIKVNPEQPLPNIAFANSNSVTIGDWVLAIGNPFRLRSTVTAGIVSALSRNVDIINDNMRIENFIQTDAAINRGNSGGALVNVRGELIGINTAIATETGGYEGYGFAVPSNLAMKIARDLIEFGEVRRAFLGVEIRTVSFERARELNLPRIEGVEIVNVVEDGAADNANFYTGDIIMAVDGQTVKTYNELQAKIAEYRPGDEVQLTVWREEERIEETITLGGQSQFGIAENESNTQDIEDEEDIERKQNPQPELRQDDPMFQDPLKGLKRLDFSFGITVVAVQRPDQPQVSDLYITGVESKSEAAKQGMEAGGKIISVNGYKMNSMSDLRDEIEEQLEDENAILITVQKDNKSISHYEITPN